MENFHTSLMNETSADLNLKELILDELGDPIREPSLMEKAPDEIRTMTDMQVYQASPTVDIGRSLLRMFAKGIPPKDVEDSGDLYVYITKIRNVMKTGKGIWKVELEDLDKLKKTLSRVQEPFNYPLYLGYIYNRIKDLEAKIHANTKS